jgi:hypothetical protein
MDVTMPRHLWPLARVVSVKTGNDGLVRTATVKTQVGSVFDRPIRKLVFLEADI